MPTERELRVFRGRVPVIVHGTTGNNTFDGQHDEIEGVILERSEDGKRCGDFEEWMVEWLDTRSFDVLPRVFVGAHTVDTPDTAIEAEADAAIAAAISRVLQEAESGD